MAFTQNHHASSHILVYLGVYLIRTPCCTFGPHLCTLLIQGEGARCWIVEEEERDKMWGSRHRWSDKGEVGRGRESDSGGRERRK